MSIREMGNNVFACQSSKCLAFSNDLKKHLFYGHVWKLLNGIFCQYLYGTIWNDLGSHFFDSVHVKLWWYVAGRSIFHFDEKGRVVEATSMAIIIQQWVTWRRVERLSRRRGKCWDKLAHNFHMCHWNLISSPCQESLESCCRSTYGFLPSLALPKS